MAAAEAVPDGVGGQVVCRINMDVLEVVVDIGDVALLPGHAVIKGDEQVAAGRGVDGVLVRSSDGQGVDVGRYSPASLAGLADRMPQIAAVGGLVDPVGA